MLESASSNLVSRRGFVIMATGTAGGLLVGCKPRRDGGTSLAAADAAGMVHFPNAWIKVSESGTVYYVLDRVEMGQGTMTSHATIVAEELGLDPSRIRVLFAPPGRSYINSKFGVQITGASTSVSSSWEPLRMAAAATRQMLIEGGARKMGVSASDCDVEEGSVVHRNTGRKLGFGELAVFTADNVAAPAAPIPRSPAGYKFIGRDVKRLDAESKVRGAAQFGLDIRLPNMLTAVVVRAPQHGGAVQNYDEAKAKTYWQSVAAEGYVVKLKAGVAAVSTNYWYAKKGAEALQATFSGGKVSHGFTGSMAAVSESEGLAAKAAAVAEKRGDVAEGLSAATKKVEAKYELPFVPHQTMEPMNCTARFDGTTLEIWAPTQMPSGAQGVAARASGIPEDKVKVNVTFIGGGFGRRIAQDYVAEVAELAVKLRKPVKIIWSREDDMRHDFYRPGSFNVMQGGVKDKSITAWSHKLIAPSIGLYSSSDFLAAAVPSLISNNALEFMGRLVKLGLDKNAFVDPFAVEGADKVPYEIPNRDVRYLHHDVGVPVGFWRSVGHSHNGFAVECFVDELAEAAGVDPMEFRYRALSGSPRDRGVLTAVRDMSKWSDVRPSVDGRKFAKGVAVHACFGSHCAIVTEVSVKDEKLTIENVWCAVDCGYVVNPDIVRAQVEGSIIFGLSAALKQKATFRDGATVEGNFNQCDVLRLSEAPRIHVEILAAQAQGVSPGGIGEVAVPASAPSLVNALAKATGSRSRKLPLSMALAPTVYPAEPPPDQGSGGGGNGNGNGNGNDNGGGNGNPPQPNPMAQAAKDSLTRHCGDCHSGSRNDGGIGYIDNLEKLVERRKVRRGDDTERKKSRVLVRIKDEDSPMPPTEASNGSPLPRMSALDIKAIEDWIMNDSPLP